MAARRPGYGHRDPGLRHGPGQNSLFKMFDNKFPDLLVIDNLASLAVFRSKDPDPWRSLQRFLMLL